MACASVGEYRPVAESDSSITTCSLCSGEYQEPRLLPCSHSFCTKCLAVHIWADKTDSPCFQCPACRSSHQKPPPGVLGIKRTYPLDGNAAKDKDPDSPVKPRLCKEPGHELMELEKYCPYHRHMVCALCARGDHRRCNLSADVQKHARDLRHEVSRLENDLNKYSYLLNTVVGNTNNAYDSFKADMTSMRYQLKLTTRKLHQLLDDHEQDLEKEFDQIEEMAGEEVTKNTQKLHVDTLASIIADVSALTNAHEDEVEDSFRVIEESEHVIGHWKEMSTKNVPTFNWESKINARHLDQRNMAGFTDLDVVSRDTPGDLVVLRGQRPVAGLAVIGGVMLVIHQGDNHIWMYDAAGCFRKSLTILQVANPAKQGCLVEVVPPTEGACKMSEHGDPRLAIADQGVKIIHIITLSAQWEVSLHKVVQLDYSPRSITTDTAKTCIVVLGSFHEENNLYMYNADGDFLSLVNLDPAVCPNPKCALRLPNMSFVVAAWGDDYHKLVWVSEDGKQTRVHGMKPDYNPLRLLWNITLGKKPGKRLLHNPGYLALTPSGSVLVAGEHGVHLLSQDGKHHQHLVKEGEMMEPGPLCMADDLLYVAHWAGNSPHLKILPSIEGETVVRVNTTDTQMNLALTLTQCELK